MIQSLYGMKDISSNNAKKFQLFIKVATKVAENYGCEFISTPLLEETSLFQRSVGEGSDIVNKEMYNFLDKSGKDICLRPEGTAGVVRSYLEEKRDKSKDKVKYFYFGPMFRYERPQKGRYRTFYQFGVESFGEKEVFEDALLILMVSEILSSLNIDFKLKINSIGNKKSRFLYKEKLVSFSSSLDICEDCKTRLKLNPLRILDCKNETCQSLYKDAPKINEYLFEEDASDFELLKSILNIDFEVDSSLVRGLDYYSKTVFEFVSDKLGSQSAIAGGGRYDYLVEELGGDNTPAVGFAIGIDRILDLIELPEEERTGIFFGSMKKEYLPTLFVQSNLFRKENKVFMFQKNKSLKDLLKEADKKGFRYCYILGEDEFNKSCFWVKDLETKETWFVPFE